MAFEVKLEGGELRVVQREPTRAQRSAKFPVALFSLELLALLDAGLNIVEALQALAEEDALQANRRVLADLLESLRRGESLSQAIAALPGIFPPLYVATIRASERTGNLKEALGRYVAYHEELDKVRKKVIASLLYPAILLVAGGAVMVFLLLYVVPRFALVYEDVSADLPLFSSLLLQLGRWTGAYGWFMFLILAALVALAAKTLASPGGRAWLAEQFWRVPALGERLRVYELARFYRTAGMLVRAGVPALRAFEMTLGLLSSGLRPRLAQAITNLAEGRAISGALTAAGLATPVATRMLLVGEKGGRMGEMMDRVARFYDEETARFADAFTRVFEPLLMAVLGIAVGLVVVLMYMPIFELAGSL